MWSALKDRRLLGGILIVLIIAVVLLVLQKKFGPRSCLILEEKYCKQVQFIDDPNTPGGLLAAYLLPPGTKIFAPIEGEFESTPKFLFKDATNQWVKNTYPGSTITVYSDRARGIVDVKYGFIYLEKTESSVYPNIKKGEVIGTVSDQEINYLGNYNLIVRIYKSGADGALENNSTMLKSVLQPK